MGFFEQIAQAGYLTWFTIGIVFAIFELIVPGFYLLWFGIASLTMGIIVNFITFTLVETFVVFTVFAGLYSALGWWVYTKLLKKNSEKNKYLNDIAGSHVGKVYQLSQDVVDGRAKAKVGDSFWLVQTDDDGLKQGDKVKVVSIYEGVILKVERYEKK